MSIPREAYHVEGERVCPRLWGPTKNHGVPHASWRWSQGQRPRPPGGPHPARGGGLQQPLVAAPACHPAAGRPGVAAGLRPAARRGVGEASGSAGDSRGRGGAGGDATGKGALYFLYSYTGALGDSYTHREPLYNRGSHHAQ